MKRRLGLLAMLLVAVGCRSAEVHVYNLREVRDPDGSVKRVGAPMGKAEYLIRNNLLTAMASSGLNLAEPKEPDLIEDPDAIALENLIDLMELDSDDPWVLGLQVEMAAWLAVDDGYRLARERATLALGKLGRALELEEPAAEPSPGTAASPDDLVGPLTELVRQVRGWLQAEIPPGAGLEASCAEIGALTLDRDGARRVVAATNALLRQVGHDAPELAPLNELFRETARRAVALALGTSLSDPDPVVRAAAFRATLRATDDRLIGLRRQALEDGSDEVLLTVLGGLAERGLWVDPELSDEERTEARLIFVSRLVELTSDLRGPVSAAACRALARVSESGFSTYRWEAWNRWWEGELAARMAAPDADRALP